MRYEFNFGSLGTVPPRSGGKAGERFRLAVLGDFSARANRGEVEVGEALAGRKPLAVDIDNFDQLISRLGIKLQLDIGGEDGTVDVAINSIDDFHPDQLYDNLELFSHLSGLRQRLNNRATFAKAAKEVQGWPGVTPAPKTKKRASSFAWHGRGRGLQTRRFRPAPGPDLRGSSGNAGRSTSAASGCAARGPGQGPSPGRADRGGGFRHRGDDASRAAPSGFSDDRSVVEIGRPADPPAGDGR